MQTYLTLWMWQTFFWMEFCCVNLLRRLFKRGPLRRRPQQERVFLTEPDNEAQSESSAQFRHTKHSSRTPWADYTPAFMTKNRFNLVYSQSPKRTMKLIHNDITPSQIETDSDARGSTRPVNKDRPKPNSESENLIKSINYLSLSRSLSISFSLTRTVIFYDKRYRRTLKFNDSV